jgi:hypothetical protein
MRGSNFSKRRCLNLDFQSIDNPWDCWAEKTSIRFERKRNAFQNLFSFYLISELVYFNQKKNWILSFKNNDQYHVLVDLKKLFECLKKWSKVFFVVIRSTWNQFYSDALSKIINYLYSSFLTLVVKWVNI